MLRILEQEATGNHHATDLMPESIMIEKISAVTLATANMSRAFEFYVSLGFELRYGGGDASFTSFVVGDGYLNLELVPDYRAASLWGRAIIYVSDVDALYERAIAAGLEPSTAPRDAEWGERYFHISDPDGHELSFARLLG
jgi:catechol 2,3-dioxygenase-like lactoylglutathione lyase family enzyme